MQRSTFSHLPASWLVGTGLWIVDLKTSHNLKVESYVLLGEFFRTSSLGDSISINAERNCPRRQGKESGYIEFATKGK